MEMTQVFLHYAHTFEICMFHFYKDGMKDLGGGVRERLDCSFCFSLSLEGGLEHDSTSGKRKAVQQGWLSLAKKEHLNGTEWKTYMWSMWNVPKGFTLVSCITEIKQSIWNHLLTHTWYVHPFKQYGATFAEGRHYDHFQLNWVGIQVHPLHLCMQQWRWNKTMPLPRLTLLLPPSCSANFNSCNALLHILESVEKYQLCNQTLLLA